MYRDLEQMRRQLEISAEWHRLLEGKKTKDDIRLEDGMALLMAMRSSDLDVVDMQKAVDHIVEEIVDAVQLMVTVMMASSTKAESEEVEDGKPSVTLGVSGVSLDNEVLIRSMNHVFFMTHGLGLSNADRNFQVI